jgi:hypothetical protein
MTEDLGFDSLEKKYIFLFLIRARRAYPAYIPDANRSDLEADCLPASSSEVKNTFTPPYTFTA